MKNFSQLITEPQTNQVADTNEVIGILFASACLAYTCVPIVGAIGTGLNSFFSSLFGGDKKDNKDGDGDGNGNGNGNGKGKGKGKDGNGSGNGSGKNDDGDGDDKKSIAAFNSLLMLSRQANEKEKDANTKKKNDAMIKLITSCSFDKDGNQVPLDQIADKMKDTMSPEQFEAFKKDMIETYEKNKDNQDFKDALVKAKANIKPEDYDKMLEEAKKEAKATLEQLEKEKKEIEEYERKLNDLDKQINNKEDDDEKDKEIRELKKQLEELKKNPPQTLAGRATGVNPGGGTPNNTDGDGEDPKDPKPKEKTKEEIDAELKAVDDKYKKQEEDLEKEYQDKIDKETDKDKKKQLEDEWMEKQKEITKQKNKEKDAIDDNDTHDTEKDETKQGKYKVKDEEITDPKTGEKIKVKTYTGPRGGKFYYPEGSPKTPEHKVYLESITLSDYMYNLFY